MARVELKGIHKQFGKQAILRGIDLTIADGEFVVLVGPSGCGKSTLLRLIAGLEEAQQGTISIDGKIMNPISPRDRGVAMVFQNYALYPHMTVYDNLCFSLKLNGMEKGERDRRVRAAAEMLGIEPLLKKRPGQLSGGQKQRVAMGRAMVKEPKVFLFDEPLSNLDAQLRVKMRAEIAALHRKLGATTIYVTHDQVEAMTLADRIAVLNQGLLEQVGPPLQVYRKPDTRFVASFIGTPSMNFLPCDLVPALRQASEVKWIGFRPEEVVLNQKKGVSLGRARVSLVEPLGASSHVHLEIGAHRLIAEVDGENAPHVASEADIWAPAETLFFFDETGHRLTDGPRVVG